MPFEYFCRLRFLRLGVVRRFEVEVGFPIWVLGGFDLDLGIKFTTFLRFLKIRLLKSIFLDSYSKILKLLLILGLKQTYLVFKLAFLIGFRLDLGSLFLLSHFN